MGLLTPLRASSSPRRPRARHAVSLQLEGLESRIVPYAVSGNAWPHPQLVTISFMPDGTDLGGTTSNLFSTFNAKFGSAAAWQNQILKAAQTWAQVTNINFAVVPDSGAASGAGSYQQGDPHMGDIRIGGYNFGSSSSTLGLGDMPPSANNYSIAGDIVFNTGQAFNVGRTYDLYTVAVHEIGHALGLLESNTSSAVMYGSYHGTATGLTSDDVTGIEQIYSKGAGRSADQYNTGGSNSSFGTATNLNALINTTSLTGLVTALNLNSTSGVLGASAGTEYFTFTVPSGTTGKMTVNVQSKGLSLLAPTLTIYNSGQSQVACVSGAGQYGTTLSLTVSGVTAGQQFYVKVAGADASPFGTGTYALTLNFGSGASPTVPLPNTETANGNPASGSGGIALQASQNPGLLGSALNLLGGVVQILADRAPGDPANFDAYPAGPPPAASPSPSPPAVQVSAGPAGPTPVVSTISPDWLAAATLSPWNPQPAGAIPAPPTPSNGAGGQTPVAVPAPSAPRQAPVGAPHEFAPAAPLAASDTALPADDGDVPALWDVGPLFRQPGGMAARSIPAQTGGAETTTGPADPSVEALAPQRCAAFFAAEDAAGGVNGLHLAGLAALPGDGAAVLGPATTACVLGAVVGALLGTRLGAELRHRQSARVAVRSDSTPQGRLGAGQG